MTNAISKHQVAKKVYLTKKMLLEKIDEIRGAVMICYPAGLPEGHPPRHGVPVAGSTRPWSETIFAVS